MVKLGLTIVPKALTGIGAVTGVAGIGRYTAVLNESRKAINEFNQQNAGEILNFERVKKMRSEVNLAEWHIDYYITNIAARKKEKEWHQSSLEHFRKEMYEKMKEVSGKKLKDCKAHEFKKEKIEIKAHIRAPLFQVVEYRYC